MYELSDSLVRRIYGGKLPVALGENSEYIKPGEGVHGRCPECKKKVISKMNRRFSENGEPLMRNHFAHSPKNPNCTIHLRSESLWHLRHKSVFPIEWCEKTVVNSQNSGKRNHRIVDVYSTQSKYTFDFESNLEGREVQARDAFYTSCGVRPSWIFKSSVNQVTNNLEIIRFTERTLPEFKAYQQPRQYYKNLTLGRQSSVLIKGSLPVSSYTTLGGLPFLDISSTAFLTIAPDRRERFYIDIQKDWILATVKTLEDFYQVARPNFKYEDRMGDPSAMRMMGKVRRAADKLNEVGGPFKLLGVDKKRYYAIGAAEKNNQKQIEEILPDNITPQDIIEAYHTGNLAQLLKCDEKQTEELMSMREIFTEMRANLKLEKMEEEDLLQYEKSSIKPAMIEINDFAAIDPFDHSPFTIYNERPDIDFEDFDRIISIVKQDIQDEIEKRKDRTREKEQPQTIVKSNANEDKSQSLLDIDPKFFYEPSNYIEGKRVFEENEKDVSRIDANKESDKIDDSNKTELIAPKITDFQRRKFPLLGERVSTPRGNGVVTKIIDDYYLYIEQDSTGNSGKKILPIIISPFFATKLDNTSDGEN